MVIPKISDNIVCKVSCPLYPIEIMTPAYFIVVQLLSHVWLCQALCHDFASHVSLYHVRLLWPPLSPRLCSNSCPLSQWCYLTISSSATLFFCLQSFPAWVFSNDSAVCIMWLKSGLPSGTSGKEPSCQCRRHKRDRFDPWVGKIPWRRAWQPTPVFLPGESPWAEEPGGLQSIGS